MADLKAFRATNHLYQKDLSEYLGVSIGFISAVERGDSKLPPEQLAKLLTNGNGWDTKYLNEEYGGGHIHNDYRQMSVGSNMEGCECNAPINNYTGLTEEDVQRRVNERTAVMEGDIRALEAENRFLKEQLEYYKAALQCEKQTGDRYLRLLEAATSSSEEK